GMKWTPPGRCGAMSLTTEDLTEPTSETVAPGARCGAISWATAPHWPTGMHAMTRSAPATAAALVSTTESAIPSSTTRWRGARAHRGGAGHWDRAGGARPRSRSGRSRSAPGDRRSAHARSRRPPQKFPKRADDEAVRLFASDRHAQRVRQLVGADGAQDQP